MSLLLNEDFTTYQLRLSYLQHIHDGVGERLIQLNTSVLNNPAFRAAGWFPDNGAIRRCYSPPIPTTGAGVASEYFQVPRKTAGVSLGDEGDGRGGMVTGNQGSEDTMGPGGMGVTARQRRRRKEQMEEEDSSDLSDDSEDEEKTAAQSIRFQKMPVKDQRSKSMPGGTLSSVSGLEADGPALMVTSPSRPPETGGEGLRSSALGAVGVVRQRARRDTTTSSDMSSDNELDPNQFSRKVLGRPDRKRVHLAEKIAEEEQHEVEVEVDGDGGETADSDLEDGDDVGEASDLSDEFEVEDVVGGSPQLLGLAVGGESADTSPVKPPPNIPAAVTPQGHNSSPRKHSKDNLPKLPKLPPGRPISSIVPPSLLTMGLKGKTGSGEKPFQRFAEYSGKGDPNPLWIKIYAPFSESPSQPIEVTLRRAKDGNPATVAELIGLALWRYNEEGCKPALGDRDSTVNRWTLRMLEDEEIDFDFPALVRTRPVTDFTLNNNRPPQRRARDKPWDEFGLVRATDEQFQEYEDITPQMDRSATPAQPVVQTPRPELDRSDSEATIQPARSAAGPSGFHPARNPITGPSLAASALRKESGNLLDMPQRDNTQSTPRTGAPKTVVLHYTDPQSFATSSLQIATTADTYIAELFDHGCQRLNLDKAVYVVKVHGTQTVAPSDRTVEALGDRLHLDLVRRRFAGAGDGIFGLGLSGSPGSSSPNAPLQLTTITTPTAATKKKKGFTLHSAAAQPRPATDSPNIMSTFDTGKRYNVLRKQPLSFATAHPRTLIISPEYLQVLPAAPDSLAAPSGKVTNIAMNMIIGAKVSRKHPKMVRVWVFREKERKRYDFEAASREEAGEICADVRKGIEGLGESGAV